MNEIQKMLKDMVVVSIAGEDAIEEHIIDARIDEIKGLPLFGILTQEQIDEVRAAFKADFSI